MKLYQFHVNVGLLTNKLVLPSGTINLILIPNIDSSFDFH